jgi:hypothetical protein
MECCVQVIQKPKSRGKFSPERHVWDAIHRDRFDRWIEGSSIDDIALAHGVSRRSIHLSVSGVLARLHRKHRDGAIELRADFRDGWKALSAGLEHFRATINPANLVSVPYCQAQRPDRFDEALERVSRQHRGAMI